MGPKERRGLPARGPAICFGRGRAGVLIIFIPAFLLINPLLTHPGAGAQEAPPADTRPGARAPRATGLPLPRFASLRANEVFMRAGPGTRYPVEWIYRRKGLPIQIIAEFDTWRKVRDWNGTTGWVHRAMLSGRRMALTIGNNTMLRRAPDHTAAPIAQARPGVIALILSCEGLWCRIDAGGLSGWATRKLLWGTFPGEKVK
jgi:SH3-like domain-containing protein